ncbi:MAG TPA: DNA-binding protein, partial [Brevibacterium sp.]|nr:DNA-binding protein [Brevibacterium sp.]
WQHEADTAPSAVDLSQYALWRSSELTRDELLGALSLLPAARSETESVEVGLLFVARSEGLTWAQIAEAMGFRSPQACQQYVNRLSARRDRQP